MNTFLYIHTCIILLIFLLVKIFLFKNKCSKAVILHSCVIGSIPLVNVLMVYVLVKMIKSVDKFDNTISKIYHFNYLTNLLYFSLVFNCVCFVIKNEIDFYIYCSLFLLLFLICFFIKKSFTYMKLNDYLNDKMDIEVGKSKEEINYEKITVELENIIPKNIVKRKTNKI